jgi:hypothetical protein
VASRVGTLDPVLDELRAELRRRLPAAPALPQRDIDRRRAPRVAVAAGILLRVGVLGVEGIVEDVGEGGLFMKSDLLVENSERGYVELIGTEPVNVRVAWIRGPSHPLGQGIGLAFETKSPDDEERALRLVLTLLDEMDDTPSRG